MLKFVQGPPVDVKFTPEPDDIAAKLEPHDVEQIAEIFNTPLTGAYNWDYDEADSRIRKLYRLGKERNWNADTDLDWSRSFPRNELPMIQGAGFNPYEGWAPFETMSPERSHEFGWHNYAWTLSQFLHGEQG